MQYREIFNSEITPTRKIFTLLHGWDVWKCILVSSGKKGDENYLSSLIYGSLWIWESEV